MRKIYRALTKDQIARGVIFSSSLSRCTLEEPKGVVHEVFEGEANAEQHIKNLKDDSFFNNSPWKYNIIRK